MEAIRNLVSTWTFKTDDSPLDAIEDKISGIKTAVVAVSASVTASAASMFGFAKFTADAADRAFDMSTKVGVAVDKLQALQYAAQLSGSNAEEMSVALRFLSRNIGEAASKNPAMIKTFKDAGVAFTETNGAISTADQVFRRLADRFASITDPAKRTKVAMDLLGRGGADMVQLLSGGSEEVDRLTKRAERLGFIMNRDVIAAGGHFNDTLDDLGFAVTSVRNRIGEGLFPILQPLVDKFMDFVIVNRELIATRVLEFFGAFAGQIETVWNFAKLLYQSVQRVVNVFGGWTPVLKAVGYALAIITGGTILYGIGALFMAIATGIATTTPLLIAWNATLLAVPILIGAAIAAIVLIVDDLIAFFSGDESVTGEIVKAFNELWQYLEEGFSGFANWVKVAFGVIMTPVRVLLGSLRSVWELLKLVTGQTTLKDAGSAIAGNIAQVFGMDSTGKGISSLSGLAGFGATSKPSIPQMQVPNSMMVDSKPSLTFNLGQGVDLGMVQSGVQSGLNSANEEMWSKAARSINGGGE